MMWAHGVAAAFCLTFDLDAESVWIAEDPRNRRKPSVLSQGRFGPRVAVPLILDLLARHDIRATFFVPGTIAEAYPASLTAIVERGHELGLHGYTHDSPTTLSPAEEEHALLRSHSILSEFDANILGYRAPGWEMSETTLRLLQKHAFLYSSNFMDEVRPYLHAGSELVELPVHWALDEAPFFWFDASTWERSIAAPSTVLEIWQAEFRGILQLGGLFVLTLHPQIIGRPHRLQLLDHWLSFVRSHPDVWIAPGREIAQQALHQLIGS